jgi:NitT/TauT family transport system permease protein
MFSTSMFKVSTAFGALTVLVCASLVLFYGIEAIQRIAFPWSLPKDA